MNKEKLERLELIKVRQLDKTLPDEERVCINWKINDVDHRMDLIYYNRNGKEYGGILFVGPDKSFYEEYQHSTSPNLDDLIGIFYKLYYTNEKNVDYMVWNTIKDNHFLIDTLNDITY